MYPTDILAFIGENNDLGRALKQYPPNVQMKYLVTARVFSALMFEPTSGLWKELMERADGKVKDVHELTGKDGEALIPATVNFYLPDNGRNNTNQTPD